LSDVLEKDPAVLRLSWSRLRLDAECPAKWQLKRDGKSSLTDIRNFMHGNVVDLAMRRWLSQENPEAGWMRAQVDAIFEETSKPSDEGMVKWKSATDRRDTLDFCRELVVRLEKILLRYALPFNYDPAIRFAVPITIPGLDGEPRELILHGEMDLLVEDRDGLIAVWDLKATKDNGYYKKVLGQLAFYAIAVLAMRGRLPAMTGLLQPMCDQQVLPVTITPQAVREMAARIERTAHNIWAGRTLPKVDDEGCNWCEVQRLCPKFDKRQVVRSGRTALALAGR
jgi:PD-(D/E)XK nuclease superfamily